MESNLVPLLLQLPTVVLVAFALVLFRSIRRQKASVEENQTALENRIATLAKQDVDRLVKDIDTKLVALSSQVEVMRASVAKSAEDHERVRDYMNNQKAALKEFGRVLSKTSEQTYNELQQLDDQVTSVRKALADHGFDLPAAA